jgi:hypothetical protein
LVELLALLPSSSPATSPAPPSPCSFKYDHVLL